MVEGGDKRPPRRSRWGISFPWSPNGDEYVIIVVIVVFVVLIAFVVVVVIVVIVVIVIIVVAIVVIVAIVEPRSTLLIHY